jgi:hypothetical protein
MPKNRERLVDVRKGASLMRRLSNEHAAADNDQIAAKLAEVAAELETRAAEPERLPWTVEGNG